MCKRYSIIKRGVFYWENFLLEPDRNTRNFITETKWRLIGIYMETEIKCYFFYNSNRPKLRKMEGMKNAKLLLEHVSKITICNSIK